MKDLKLTIRINKPVTEVFEFTTNPLNTARWIDSVVKEISDTYPPHIGTIYQNWDETGKMNEYKVTQFELPKVFQLDATNQDYKVRYTYTSTSENETELEYYEWCEFEQLDTPFTQEILIKLKDVMEARA
jgi:uncharacterized protein YndB with AHSA1/START domain